MKQNAFGKLMMYTHGFLDDYKWLAYEIINYLTHTPLL